VSAADGTGAAGAAPSPLAALRAEPARAAVLTDVDGTLAPIVERPEMAAVPERASRLLRQLAGRYALVGCISGRQALDARRLVGVAELAYAGNHGLEVLLPGEDVPRLDPALAGEEASAAALLSGTVGERLEDAELRQEDKGPIQALHWRGAADEVAAEALAQEIASEAEGVGLQARWGRKVLELRPARGGGKEAAVSILLEGRNIAAATYAGDDRTDLDAFRRLRELRRVGRLQAAVCVGVVSGEAPVELAAESDLTVDPDGWLNLLAELAA
jgi:trehalose-phosphatase